MDKIDRLVRRVKELMSWPPPRGEAAAAELDQLAADLLGCGVAEADAAVRYCRSMADEARR